MRSCLQQFVSSGAKLTLVSQPSLGSRVTPFSQARCFYSLSLSLEWGGDTAPFPPAEKAEW